MSWTLKAEGLAKGYGVSDFLLDLGKGLLLLRAPVEIVLLTGNQVERTHDLAVLGNVHPPETYGA